MTPGMGAKMSPLLFELKMLPLFWGILLIWWYPHVLMVAHVEIHTSDIAKAD